MSRKMLAGLGAILLGPLAAFAAEPTIQATPEDVGLSTDRLAGIDRFVKEEMDDGVLPGAVVAIARRGKVVYFKAFGYRDKEAGVAMTTDSIFSAASMTKPMTAVLGLQFYERGHLLMDDPLSMYFPKFAEMQVAVLDDTREKIVDKVPAARPILMQDLYRHTSGLAYGSSGNTAVNKLYPMSSNDSARTLTSAELLDKLAGLPLHHQPGAQWQYSFGLDVLGFAIEALEKKSLGQVMNAALWSPLGMTDTGFMVPADKVARYARPLPKDRTGRPLSIPSPLAATRFECGGGCAVTTAGDYLAFAQMLLNGGTLGGARILSRKTVDYMVSNQLAPGTRSLLGGNFTDWGFGLGVAVRTTPGIARGTGSVGEFGWPGAFGTYWWADPAEHLAVVWMTASPNGYVNARHRQVLKALVNGAIVD
ncbi:MAG: serine hydrolase domain-containing protein [Reyranellaceae bacterium]